jgi:hypothetical protein
MVVDESKRNDKQKVSEKSIQPENAKGMQPRSLLLGAANSF